MKNLFGFGLALAATTALAPARAGGDDPPTGGPESPSSTLFQNVTVTFKPGSGITFDGGEQYKINVAHRIQAKWRYVSLENAENTNGFRMRRVRQKWTGHVWSKDITYNLNLDFAEDAVVKDAWVRWAFWGSEDGSVALRMGQQKARAGLESDGSSGNLEFVERSVATRTFADARSTGALLEGEFLDERKLHVHAGAFNSDTSAGSAAAAEENTNVGENELNFSFGVRFDPHAPIADIESWSQGDLEHTGEMQSTLGANLYIGNEKIGAADVESTNINIYAGLKTGGGLAAQGEVWLRNDDVDGGTDADSTGWYAQGSLTTKPMDDATQWGFALRVAMVSFDDAPVLVAAPSLEGASVPTALAAAGDVFEINGAISAYYHQHALKTQFGYTYQQVDPDAGTSEDNHAIEVMVTTKF
jgi:hypothetical protein